MEKWFNEEPRILQVLFLLLPLLNWIIEVGVRWALFIETKTKYHLVMAILAIPLGLLLSYIDVFWCILFKHLIIGVI